MSDVLTPAKREFWLPKFEKNVARDRLVNRTLREQGGKVVRVWECELAGGKNWLRIAGRLRRALGEVGA